MATLSILGLYDYDPTIFEGLTLPTAADITNDADKVANPWVPVKQDLVEYLLMECAELECLWPSVPTLKKMIGIWSKARQPVWKALYNTLLYKYNPIWNKDGVIEETRSDSGSDTLTRNLTSGELETRDLAGTDNETRNLSGTDNETRNLQITDAGTASSETSGTVLHNVTGYDTNAYSPDTQDVTSGTTDSTTGNTRTDTGTVNRQTTDTGTDNRQTTDTGTINRSRTDGGTEETARESEGTARRVEQGNIGVTMTQDMIQKQRDIVMFNLYDVIVSEFKSRFCLLVY